MTTLPALLTQELTRQGVDVDELDENDFEYAAVGIRSLVTRLKARTAWEGHLGALLNHGQVLQLTGWSKQALSQAVNDHRVLRLDSGGNHAYLLGGFDDQTPARPLRGIKKALAAWAAVDERGWAAASWLMSPQPELGGRTPRDALVAGQADEVAALAEQAAARLSV